VRFCAAVMRVIMLADSDILPLTAHLLQELQNKVQQTAGNPGNASFTHYLFESVAALIRVVCASDVSAAQKFELFLFPTFQAILQQDVQGMTPVR